MPSGVKVVVRGCQTNIARFPMTSLMPKTAYLPAIETWKITGLDITLTAHWKGSFDIHDMSAEFGRSTSLFTIHGQDKLTYSEIVRRCSGWNDKWLVEIFVTYRYTFPVVIPTKRVMQRHMFPSLPFFLWGWVGVYVAHHYVPSYVTSLHHSSSWPI